MYCQSGQMERAAERLGGKKVSKYVQVLNERQEIFKNTMEDKLWLQGRATESWKKRNQKKLC